MRRKPEKVKELGFEQMVQEIVKWTGIQYKKLMGLIRKKQEGLFGFITPEGAAILVARELGITFKRRKKPRVQTLRIRDLAPEVPRVELVGKVAGVYGPRVFKRMIGEPGLVGSLLLQDRTGQVKLVLWNDKTSLIKQGKVRKGDIVRVRNAYVRRGPKQPELSLGRRGSIIVRKPSKNSEWNLKS